jgi:hypothetical protein
LFTFWLTIRQLRSLSFFSTLNLQTYENLFSSFVFSIIYNLIVSIVNIILLLFKSIIYYYLLSLFIIINFNSIIVFYLFFLNRYECFIITLFTSLKDKYFIIIHLLFLIFCDLYFVYLFGYLLILFFLFFYLHLGCIITIYNTLYKISTSFYTSTSKHQLEKPHCFVYFVYLQYIFSLIILHHLLLIFSDKKMKSACFVYICLIFVLVSSYSSFVNKWKQDLHYLYYWRPPIIKDCQSAAHHCLHFWITIFELLFLNYCCFATIFVIYSSTLNL